MVVCVDILSYVLQIERFQLFNNEERDDVMIPRSSGSVGRPCYTCEDVTLPAHRVPSCCR